MSLLSASRSCAGRRTPPGCRGRSTAVLRTLPSSARLSKGLPPPCSLQPTTVARRVRIPPARATHGLRAQEECGWDHPEFGRARHRRSTTRSANFLELRHGEVRRISLPRTRVNNGGETLRLSSSALARLAGYCYLSCLRMRRSRLKGQPRVVCCSLDHSPVSLD